MNIHEVDVVIVGGGPAGMVCGILLAEQGVKTLVLESHANFDREYRGEVLMPRFLQAMKQVKLFDHLMKYPHLKLDGFELFVKNKLAGKVGIPEISKEAPFILWMPQPVMLNAFLDRAKMIPDFDLWFGSPVTELLRENDRVVGVHTSRQGEAIDVRAKITIGADGRTSTIRKKGGFEPEYEDHNFDLLWFTIPKPDGWDNTVRAFISKNHNYLTLPKYPNHIQVGILMKAGEFAEYRKKGIEVLRKEILEAHPILKDFALTLKDFSPFVVLAALVERMREWAKDGVILIGDSAHTCSPAGAIGVSVAVGTSIVAADVIADAIQAKDYSKAQLSRVQKLREAEVKDIQGIQNGAATLIAVQIPGLKTVAAWILILLAKTRVFSKIQRRLMVAKGPLPVKRWI